MSDDHESSQPDPEEEEDEDEAEDLAELEKTYVPGEKYKAKTKLAWNRAQNQIVAAANAPAIGEFKKVAEDAMENIEELKLRTKNLEATRVSIPSKCRSPFVIPGRAETMAPSSQGVPLPPRH